jgi:signal transduction histidine kinase
MAEGTAMPTGEQGLGGARLELLVESVLAVSRSLDLGETLRAVVDAARSLTGARYAALGVLGEDRRIARFVTSGLTPEEVAAIGPYPTGRGILGVVIDEERPLRLRDLTADPRSAGFPPEHPPMRSFLGVPVLARDAVFGNLYLTEAPSGEFGEVDEQLLQLLAVQAGHAIDHAQAYEEARRQAEEARRSARARESLSEMAETILRERDVNRVMEQLAREARELVGARLVGIGVPEELTATIRFPVAVGEGAGVLLGREEPMDGIFSGSVLQAGVPLRLGEGEMTAGGLRPVVESTTQLLVPVLSEDEPVAVIVAFDSARPDGFSQDDQDLLEALASLGAIAFQAARAFRRERLRSEAAARLRQLEGEAEARREGLRRVVETQERERRRIAQDLHDHTAGALASIGMALRRLERTTEDEQLAAGMSEIRNDISNAIYDLRDLIADLRPKVLDDFGLDPALERLADTTARRSGIKVDYRPAGDTGEVRPELATAAYRVVQESLVNAERHARATWIAIATDVTDGRLVVTVEDDGIGMGGPVSGTGLGVAGMHERAALVDGLLTLAPRDGGGTVVRFEAQT